MKSGKPSGPSGKKAEDAVSGSNAGVMVAVPKPRSWPRGSDFGFEVED